MKMKVTNRANSLKTCRIMMFFPSFFSYFQKSLYFCNQVSANRRDTTLLRQGFRASVEGPV